MLSVKQQSSIYKQIKLTWQYLGDKEPSIGRLIAHCNSQGSEEKTDQFNDIITAY